MLPQIVAFAVRVLAFTWRVDRPPWPVSGPCVVAFWHGEQLPMVGLHRGLGMIGIASRSRDGERAARVLGHLGYAVLRGSTSNGGTEVLRAASRALQAGGRPALAVDGPRGPAGGVHPGAAVLARLAGVPVVFGRVYARGWRLKSWDRFLIPWPFTRVKVEYGVWWAGDEESLAERMGAPTDP